MDIIHMKFSCIPRQHWVSGACLSKTFQPEDEAGPQILRDTPLEF